MSTLKHHPQVGEFSVLTAIISELLFWRGQRSNLNYSHALAFPPVAVNTVQNNTAQQAEHSMKHDSISDDPLLI